MIMDLLVLTIFALSIFFSMRHGFAETLAGFMKGTLAVVAAWLLCGKLSRFLLNIPVLRNFASERIQQGLTAKWENSYLYNLLPTLFTKGENSISDAIINEGVAKILWLFFTIISFLIILITIRIVASLLERRFSHRRHGGFIGLSDRLLGLLLGSVIGIFNVMLILALILPAAGLFVPSLSKAIPTWFESSLLAKDIYDNNLLLILLRDFLA